MRISKTIKINIKFYNLKFGPQTVVYIVNVIKAYKKGTP